MSARVYELRDVQVLPTPVDVLDAEVIDEATVGDPWLPLPWDIDNRIREVDAAVTAVDRQVHAHRVRLGADYVKGWASFRDAWRHFHRGHQSMLLYAWQGVFRWSDIHERVVEYELRTSQWRRAAEERGVRFVTPEASPRPRPPAEASAWDDAKPIAIAAAVGLSALAVIAVVNKLS